MKVSDASPLKTREKSKAESRAKLIEAAAASIRAHGIHGTTIGRIQEISGLSRGMIGLHFNGKDNLLLALAEGLCTRYDQQMRAAVAAAGPDPAAQLIAVFEADTSPEILNERDVAIWFSFRAEMHGDARFRALIGTRSGGFLDLICSICAGLMPAASSGDVRMAGNALVSLMEGTWTEFHLDPSGFDRGEARRTCLYVAEKLFPEAEFAVL